MSDIKFEVIKRIGVLSETTKSTFELCLVKWNDKNSKYDLRKWGENSTKPYKGITFTREEVRNIYEILVCSLNKKKSMIAKYDITVGKATAQIFEVLGEYKQSNSMPGKITYISWGGSPKYDIRPWNLDYSVCGKGVTLNENECTLLISYLKNELDLNVKDEYDTSEIDMDLFI